MLLTLYAGFYCKLIGASSGCCLSFGEGWLRMRFDLLQEYAYGCL